MIDLYTAATGNGRRATIMLEECGLQYRAHKIEIGAGAAKPIEFLKINPEGTVPMIVDPDGPAGRPISLRQSSAILIYLAEKTGTLLPGDPSLRPAMLEWMMLAITDLVAANTAMYQTMTEFSTADAGVAVFFRNQLIKFLRICDRRLGASKYLAGAEITIADVALFPVLISRRAVIDGTAGLENLKRWGAEIAARPAVQRALAIAT
jgi:GST-like protein